MGLIIELLFKNNWSFLSVRFREYKVKKKKNEYTIRNGEMFLETNVCNEVQE